MGTSEKYRPHFCLRCGRKVDGMTRDEQDTHEIECKKQKTLQEAFSSG